jgi:peptidoglycan/xylan/chitin deacetylase (PgdA/CDA1 family)
MSILCYHAVQPGWRSPMSVEPAVLDEHCGWLSRRRFVVPLQEAVHRLDATGRLPRGLAALTFDDGFSSLHEHGFPVLARHRLPATVFLVAETLTAAGRPVDWVDTAPAEQLTTLTIEQVREMQDAGIRFESHSFSHLDLTSLSFEDCVRDLTDSRELLETLLGRPVRLLAYPRGRHNASVRAAAERAGYSHAFTLPEGREPVGPYAVPRVGLFDGNDLRHLRVKSARSYLRLRTGRPYQVVRQLRRTTSGAPS